MRRTGVIISVVLLLLINIGFSLYLHHKHNQAARILSPLLENPFCEPSSQDKQSDLQQLAISRHNAITSAVEKVEPAVVSINVIKTEIGRRIVPFFGYVEPFRRKVPGLGSGVIFRADGYIITNAHVVNKATEIKVTLIDDRHFDGILVGIDTRHDIAIIKIETDEDIPFAKLGDSDQLIIGEWSIAVGNPYKFMIKDSNPSVSVGVISAVNRNFTETKDGKFYKEMVQTDAAINPGNSGGPLVNIYGEVIAINTFIFSESGGNIGIGFATPINRVKKIADELISYGKIRERWFGFQVQELNPIYASYLEATDVEGVIVSHVDSGGPAEKAGVKLEDIILKINDSAVTNTREAELSVSDIGVGELIKLTLLRKKKEITVVMTPEEL
ncbi:MAG: trypsin-like peptidase domain-containing protein [Candidatus Cloacimonetes bacterium]|nr:trypsin-like peptidase domain-containing protein [Candidatus Cloacimonadota bacterium]